MLNRAPTVVMSMNSNPLPYGPGKIEEEAIEEMSADHSYSTQTDSSYSAQGAGGSNGTDHAHLHGGDGQQRVSLACMRCRKQKLKCDGTTPACARCVKRGTECVYSTEPTGRKNGSKKKAVRKDKRRAEDTGALSVSTGRLESNNAALKTVRSVAELILPSQRQTPQLVALEQLSRKLKMELDSYTTMAKHWQEQLRLLHKGGVSAVTDKQALAWVRRELHPRPPSEPSGRPHYLPESQTAGESWSSYTSESHPAVHLAHSMVAFSDRSLVANPIATMQDPSQVDLRCHRFRMMRFWNMSSPRELLTDDLNYDTLVATWDLLLQPISTVIQGNSFVDDIGRPLEDDLEETRTIDSIAIFAHTAELKEVLTVMRFGCLFFHATQLVGWDDQMQHLITNVDRLVHVAFFQRCLSNVGELADEAIEFVMWYVWRYKAFQMTNAYRSLLSLGYQTLLSNFDHVTPHIAASLNTLLVTTSASHAQMMHHVHLSERIEHSPLKKALLGLAIAIVTLNREDSPIHQYEKLESDYPELLRIISQVDNPFDPDNHAISSTALFLHAEVLVRLGRDICAVEELIDTAVRNVTESQSCGAVHLLFSNMFMFQATVNTVVQFSSGVTCTVSDYARIELAKALGFPLSTCSNIHEKVDHSASPCKLKFGEDFAAALSRLGQFQPCDGSCTDTGSSDSSTPAGTFLNAATPSEVITPNSEDHTHYHYSSPTSTMAATAASGNIQESVHSCGQANCLCPSRLQSTVLPPQPHQTHHNHTHNHNHNHQHPHTHLAHQPTKQHDSDSSDLSISGSTTAPACIADSNSSMEPWSSSSEHATSSGCVSVSGEADSISISGSVSSPFFPDDVDSPVFPSDATYPAQDYSSHAYGVASASSSHFSHADTGYAPPPVIDLGHLNNNSNNNSNMSGAGMGLNQNMGLHQGLVSSGSQSLGLNGSGLFFIDGSHLEQSTSYPLTISGDQIPNWGQNGYQQFDY